MALASEDKVRVEVLLPKELYEKAVERGREAGFNSFNEFLTFLLEQIVEEEETEASLSPEDEERIKERLRSLGYID
ncbi:MAG: CopG family transcriptional regulator [Thermoprotei archaeon]|nr:MAG: CopG family transcriptional regulator [Thermoprotei archaeon]RLG81812.1 MAG: CopG family transcriptional regulator [Thermoprotei archaeon]